MWYGINLEKLQKAAEAVGFKWRQCSEWHWQTWGGTKLLNVYSGKRGCTIYVPGMYKSQPVANTEQIVEFIKELAEASKDAEPVAKVQPVARTPVVPVVADRKPSAAVSVSAKPSLYDTPFSHVEIVTVGLLACPFCGSAAEERPDRKYPELIRIACTGCDATSCPYGLQHHKKDAIDDWNTRVIAGQKTTFRFEQSEDVWTASTSQHSYGPFPSLDQLLTEILAGTKTH